MTTVQTFHIPNLASVRLDNRTNDLPLLEIVLADTYVGDLNDTAAKSPGPDCLYLSCDSASAIDSPELAKFLEVMHQWDHTGDGVPDCDEIIDAIMDVFWGASEPNEFQRPHEGLYTKALMSTMPAAPSRHIVFSFGELKPRYRWYHYASAVPMLAAFIGSVYVQNEAFPWMKYSVISGFLAGTDFVGLPGWAGIPLFIVLYLVYSKRVDEVDYGESFSKHTYGFFNKAAVFEEQAFREGSEHWSLGQRVRSCLAFGAIHMVNLIYPLAAILPLTLCGAVFMFVYLRAYRDTPFRRTAVLKAAVMHRVYNRIALAIMVVALLVWFGLMGVAMLGAIGLLSGVLGMVRVSRRRFASLGNETQAIDLAQV